MPALAVAVLVGVGSISLQPGIAAAKDPGAMVSYVTVSGPGLGHPWVLHATGTAPKGYRGATSELFVNLATRLGMLGEGASARPMSPPDPTRLGPPFEVKFFLSCGPNGGRCRTSVHELLYPFALLGAVAYVPPGQERPFVTMFGRKNVFDGWFRVFEGDLVRRAIDDSRRKAVRRSAAPASQAARPTVESFPSPFLAAGITVIMILGLLSLAYGARRRLES